ncbi:MAG TPA: hypothetical protein VFP44_07915 [Usitatibacter sp.]|nr:hypothetical protein [Usitatibacter sp.]
MRDFTRAERIGGLSKERFHYPPKGGSPRARSQMQQKSTGIGETPARGELSNHTMKRKPPVRTPLPLNAAIAWTTLGMKWMEMLGNSAQVVAHRTSRHNTPAQLFAMGSEKVQAAMESSNAMTRHMIGFPVHDAFASWNAWARLLASGLAPYHARTRRNARTGRRRR